MSKSFTVLVADDHQLFRTGFCHLIKSFGNFSICHESSNGEDVLNYLSQHHPDIITLDLGMPGFPHTTILKAIRQVNQRVKILIVSMHDEISLIKQTIQQGADGYLTKDANPEEVQEAFTQMSKGQRYLPKSLAEQLAFSQQQASVPNALTSRELEILRMISEEGLSLVEIAHRLNISPKTVTSHKNNIMLKLNVKNNAELITMGLKVLH